MYSIAAAQLAKQNNIEEGPLLMAMASAVRSGELKVRDPKTGAYFVVDAGIDNPSPYVTMQDVNTWLISNGYPYCWDNSSANSTISTCSSGGSKKTNIFLSMKQLNASELGVVFVGDTPDCGRGNSMLEISARGKKVRMSLAELDLVDRRRGSLNSQGVILLGMAAKIKLPNTPANAKKMQRLREVFKAHLGISSDPFFPHNKSNGWKPIFKLENKLGAADERAKAEAERRTVSLDQRNESGEKASADYYENDENSIGAEWLRQKDMEMQH
jgi:hypothetical protein